MDHRKCHPRSPLRPPIGGQDGLCPPRLLGSRPVCYFYKVARQSQSGSITITQQLCVFVEDYIFKRTLVEPAEGGEESSVTNYEGAHSRVQKAEALTPVTPLCGKIQPHNAEQHGGLCCCHLLSVPLAFSSLSLLPSPLPNHCHSLHAKALGEKGSCQVEIIHYRAKY